MFGVACKPGPILTIKHHVNQTKDRRRGAERKRKTCVLQSLAGLLEPAPELRLHAIKGIRVCPLKGIDRLFLVADHKNGALNISAGTFTGGELLRQFFHHIPLHRAGVLGLIHKDMIDAAVQTIEHPRRHRWIIQKVAGLDDKVVEIKPAPQLLAPFIFR